MNRIAKRLDPRLDEITLFHELTNAESLEFDHLNNELAEVESNMTLSGTTERCIDRREAEFGVTSDSKKPIEQRRAVLIAKLQGQGTTTPEKIMEISRVFGYGNVIVDEESAPYTVRIVFTEYIGVPENISDFIFTIEEIKPAHLNFVYVYKFNTWGDYVAFNHSLGEWRDEIRITWGGIKTYTESNEDVTENIGVIKTFVEASMSRIRKEVAKINGLSK